MKRNIAASLVLGSLLAILKLDASAEEPPSSEAMNSNQRTHAFFVEGRTEPISGGRELFGSITRIILYDAPSKDAAEAWTRQYVTTLLLEKHPDQKLKELLVQPLHDALLTSTGEVTINWPLFKKQRENCYYRPIERGSNGAFMARKDPTTFGPDQDSWKDVAMVREKARDANQMNWDKKKQCFYLVYNKYRAYVVQAMNMMFVGPSYFEAIKGTTEAELRADFSICPDVKEYGPSAPSPTPSLATFGR